MSLAVTDSPERDEDGAKPVQLTQAQKNRRRGRSVAIAIALAVLVLLFYLVTIVKLGPNILDRSL